MQQRTIADVTVSAIGLGGMPMSIEGRPDEARSIATIHAALDAGVTLIDTADAYHLHADEVGHNEALIAEALRIVGRRRLRRARRDQGRPPAPRRRLVDARRPPRAPQAGRARPRSSGSASRRSASTSSTAPTRTSRTPTRSARSATCWTRARSGWPASPTPTRTRSGEAQRDPRRPAGVGAEPVLAGVPLQRARARACATSSASRSCRGARSAASRRPATLGSTARGVRRGRASARREPAAGRPGLDARACAGRHPDPGRLAPGDDPRLGAGRRPRAHRGGARRASTQL